MRRPPGSSSSPSLSRSSRSSRPNGSRGAPAPGCMGADMLVVDVEKQLGDFKVAAKFETPDGVTALFGPSGSGKTSIINMVAGLLMPDRGRIAINGTLLFDSNG